MNVVKHTNFRKPLKSKNKLIKRDGTLGIRGPTTLIQVKSFNAQKCFRSANAPRYNFTNDENCSAMGPPPDPPKAYKRKLLDSSTSGRMKGAKVLASDSALMDSSRELRTPRNKNTALRYISSSSRGAYSAPHSAKSTSVSIIEPSVILAISEGRGMARGEIGIAAIDLRRPQLILCQFSDTLLYTHTLTKINYFNPIEIIVPHTFCEGVQPNQLYRLIKDQYPVTNLTTVQRRHFNDASGRQQIQSLCAPEYSSVYLQVLHKFYALTAAAAVLKYVEYIQCIVFARESLKIEYHSSENTMIIDVGTATQLELVQPLVPSAGATCCLLGVLGPTYTIGGIRALRAAILQPSCKKDFIETRLDAVQELIDNDSGLMLGLQDVIKKLADIDKILLLCIDAPVQNVDKMGEAQMNQTLLLKITMDLVPNLIEALNVAESGKLRKIKMDFQNVHYQEISTRIASVIQDDAHVDKGYMGSFQRCFAVKPDINGLLDVARRTYSELIEDIQKIVEHLSETYDLPIRLNQNTMKGFHIILTIAPKNRRNFKIEDLPPIFIQVQNNGASISMTTEELVVLDQQAKETLNEILRMSNIVIYGLLKDLRPFMSSLYKLCENVAELDILLALAQASSIGSYIRPEFNNYLDIRNSVHPLLDYNSQVLPVPNDISATPEHNFTIITGPNMGGKSIYIKQIALMQIMAQLGCFLPATNAVLRLCDRIFSRVGFNDSVELNASTYVLEMKEIQHILQALTPSSLIIIDELCRGTCSEEGASIAWAICEELIISDAFVFFTTHFIYLTRLQDLYFNVVNLHTTVSEEIISKSDGQKKLKYEHKISIGITKVEHYGLALASNTNLPIHTVNLARELSELITKNKKPQAIQSPEITMEFLLYKLNSDIVKETRNYTCDVNVSQMLNDFKTTYPFVLEKLKFNNSEQQSVPKITTPENITTDINEPLIQLKLNNDSSNIIFTTSDDNNNCDDIIATSVKSINELFNTVIDDSNVTSSKQAIDTHSENSQKSNKTLGSISEIHCSQNDLENHTSQMPIKEFILNENRDLTPRINRNSQTYDNIVRQNEMFESDEDDSELSQHVFQTTVECDGQMDTTVDISEQLTQIINNEEFFDDIESYISATDDEDLVRETIDEIHKDIEHHNDNANFMILTPPVAFRDE